MKITQLLIKIIALILLVSYPFIIYFGLSYLALSTVALFILGIGLLRYFLLRFSHQKDTAKKTSMGNTMQLIVGFSIVLPLLSLIFNSLNWMLYYPVIVNVVLLFSFAYSLAYPPSMIERFARLTEKDLPPSAVRYTCHITQVWCFFFTINGTIALISTIDLDIWTLYNGFISYILMGLLLSGEWVYRQWRIKKI